MITVITDLRFEASLARKLKNSRIEKDLCVTNSHYVIHMADKKTEIVPFYCVSRIFITKGIKCALQVKASVSK